MVSFYFSCILGESRSNGNSLVPINNSRIHKSASDANFGRFRNSKSYKNSHHHFSPRKNQTNDSDNYSYTDESVSEKVIDTCISRAYVMLST